MDAAERTAINQLLERRLITLYDALEIFEAWLPRYNLSAIASVFSGRFTGNFRANNYGILAG
ncbi:MAG: hypothetical protein V9H26_03695 [Verrucomicrobiota bacterium]